MVNGFIVFPTYEIIAGKPIVQLFGRLETGETFRADFTQDPYFFIRASDVDVAKQTVQPLTIEETELKTMSGESVVKVIVDIPKEVPPLRKLLAENDVFTYEGDIRFSYRFLIDNNLKGAIHLEGNYVQGDRVDRVYTNPSVKPGVWKSDLTVLSMDIETNKTAKELWSVSLATSTGREEKFIMHREVKGAHCFDSEADLLSKLTEVILDIDPDIVTGWNFIDFDMKVLQEKYKQHKLVMDWSRSTRPVRLRLESDFLRESTAEIAGRMVLDGISLLKINFVKLNSYTLESASQKFASSGKIFSGANRYEQIVDAYNNDPALLLEYNLLDCNLVLEIFAGSGVLDLTIRRSLLTGMQLDRVKASIASLDMVYLPRLREKGFVAPSAGYSRKDQGITGGFVMDSKPGIYDYVIVCDFKSLYPSIMRTLNIDPLAYEPQAGVETSDTSHIVAENGAVFRQEAGILPEILDELLTEREAARKRGDEGARFAIKILMNSFFGVLASPNCRFFSMDVANAITHSGQHLIKETSEYLSKKGYDVVYGDTDSIFVDLKVDSEQKANTIGKEIEKEVNAYFTAYVEKRYCRESKLELEYEKLFIRFLMPMTRSGEGSKKRYAGLLQKDGKEEIDFTGLEFVRRDWTEIAKDFQLTILDLIFHRKDPQAFIKKYVEEVRSGKHDDKLVYTKALRKPLHEYTKTTPPHVKAARLLDKIESKLIRYVITVDGPEPIGFVKHSIDHDHYVEKQLRPIADSILVFYGTNLEDVLKGTQQKGLFDF